ncbi:hypothetical protein PV11_01089 [Exophiala sideris]|uniref:Uncharacterized protein n=1 Tax=Exophiala sideris TaxID=1016849 RepID=A0A0D1XBU7_9EURO|nr:hypothetical protein PV11_01089 [Exophiala sideris]
MGGRTGRLGLLADIATDHEIETLCSEWTLPPADERSEDNDDDNDHYAEDVIVVRHVEWICKRKRTLPIVGPATRFCGAPRLRENEHQGQK